MTRLITFLIILTTSISITANDDKNDYRIRYYLQTGNTYYIYSDIANVREGSDIDSEKQDQLNCGEEVTLLEVNENKPFSSNGITGRWLKIGYTKNNEKKEGYVWEANISPSQLRRNNTKFVFGIDSRIKDSDVKNDIKQQVKVVQHKKIISRSSFTNERIPFITAKVIDDSGLENNVKVIKLDFSGEACGIPSIEHYFAWDGENINYIDNTYSVGDADIYGYSETLILPKAYDCYGCNIIIKLISQYETPDTDGDIKVKENKKNEPIYRNKTKTYLWNGKNLMLQNESWKGLRDTEK